VRWHESQPIKEKHQKKAEGAGQHPTKWGPVGWKKENEKKNSYR